MSTSIITAADLPAYLIPGMRSSTISYLYYQNEYKNIFTILPTIKNTEVDVQSVPLSAAAQFSEGSEMPTGDMKQYLTTYSKMFQYGVGFIITSISIEDNLYPDEFPKGLLGIKENLNIVKEQEAISVFDNGFSTADPQYTLADGQSYFSQSHPVVGGAVSNTLTNSQLNETVAEDLIKVIQSFKDNANLQRKFEAKRYLVGIDNQFAAEILTGSAYSPNDTTNAINPLTYGEYLQGGFILSHYMTNPKNFFMLTNLREGVVLYERKPLSIQMTTDQSNLNLGVYGSERYRFNVIDFRSAAGVQSF
jgi:hypothetical protein